MSKHTTSLKERKFSISADDSSGEEDSVEEYDITNQIQKFKEGWWGNLDQDTILSFIGHAAGIYLLYGPAVQKRYYELKGDKLVSPTHLTNFKKDEDIKSDIEENISKISCWAGHSRDQENTTNIFEVMRNDLFQKIVEDKISYCKAKARLKVHKDYFERMLTDKNLNTQDVTCFYSNFALPNPMQNNFQRQTLDDTNFDLSLVTSDHFVVEFLSHLRLHNRSEKRHIRNKEECKNTSWKIFVSETANVDITLQNAHENNTKYSSRNEQVSFNGNIWATYSHIFENQTEEEFSILLRNRVNIKKDLNADVALSPNILSLWYLLFGCEVIKNPAAIIHNNMVLDIAEHELGRHQLLAKQEIIGNMPMSAEKILKKVMFLNSFYTDFMPHKYEYNLANGYDYKEILIKRESDITKKWLELKLGKAVANYLLDQCKTDNNAVKAIWDLIAESFERWGLESCIQQVVDVVEGQIITPLANPVQLDSAGVENIIKQTTHLLDDLTLTGEHDSTDTEPYPSHDEQHGNQVGVAGQLQQLSVED